MNDIIQGFYEIAGMPCTIGAVDGTHILVKPPKEEEWTYVNRKGQHSINVQVSGNCKLLPGNPLISHNPFVIWILTSFKNTCNMCNTYKGSILQ